jgi:hypothetical protein
MMPADDVLYDAQAVCVSCDAVVTELALCPDGRCKECHAKDRDVKTRNGDVQCGKCKRYYIPEVINDKTFHCVSCERKLHRSPRPKARASVRARRHTSLCPRVGSRARTYSTSLAFRRTTADFTT